MSARVYGSLFLLIWIMACHLYEPEVSMASEPCSPIIVDLLLGEPVSIETALDDMATTRVVYVGEYHSIPRHHALEAQILRGLIQRNPNVSLAMEIFTSDQQSIVDKWLQSDQSVSDLLNNLGHDRWTNLVDYASVLTTARDLKIPVIGLNISGRIVRKVATGGLESLSSEEKALLPPDVEPINPLYSRLLSLKLKVHRAFKDKSLSRIIYAQALRDTTMASNIVRYLQSPHQSHGVLMVIAGAGHLNYGFGIPERVKSQVEVTSRLILLTESGELRLSESEKQQAVDIEISRKDLEFIDRRIADYLSVVPIKTNDEHEAPDPPHVMKRNSQWRAVTEIEELK